MSVRAAAVPRPFIDSLSPSSLEFKLNSSLSKVESVPIYEYVCKKCPECGGPVEQAIHAPAVQFKGTGWYVTDYAKKGESKDSGSKPKEESHASKEAGKEKSEDKSKKSHSKKHD